MKTRDEHGMLATVYADCIVAAIYGVFGRIVSVVPARVTSTRTACTLARGASSLKLRTSRNVSPSCTSSGCPFDVSLTSAASPITALTNPALASCTDGTLNSAYVGPPAHGFHHRIW